MAWDKIATGSYVNKNIKKGSFFGYDTRCIAKKISESDSNQYAYGPLITITNTGGEYNVTSTNYYKCIKEINIARNLNGEVTFYYAIFNNKNTVADTEWIQIVLMKMKDGVTPENYPTWTWITNNSSGSTVLYDQHVIKSPDRSNLGIGKYKCAYGSVTFKIPSSIDLTKQYYIGMRCGSTSSNKTWYTSSDTFIGKYNTSGQQLETDCKASDYGWTKTVSNFLAGDDSSSKKKQGCSFVVPLQRIAEEKPSFLPYYGLRKKVEPGIPNHLRYCVNNYTALFKIED